MLDKVSEFIILLFYCIVVAGVVLLFMPKSLSTIEEKLGGIHQELYKLNEHLREKNREDKRKSIDSIL